MKKNFKLSLFNRVGAAALVLASSLVAAQNPIPGTPRTETPRAETPRQGGGGGVGIGINIDIGSVINAVRNRQNSDKNTNDEVDRSAKEQLPFVRTPMSVEQLSQQLKADQARRIMRSALTTGTSQRAGFKLAPQAETCAINGNFELANLSQWAGADNGPLTRNNSSRWNITTPGINTGALNADSSHQNLVGPGNDPTLGALLQQVRPGGGSSSVRIGNTAVNYGSELLAKSFKVSASNAIVGFSYAVVMQNPGGHSPSDQPSFAVRVLDANGVDITNNIPGGRVKLSPGSVTPNVLIADAANPFFKTFGSSSGGPVGGGGEVIVYKDWACSEINLSDLVGQDVTIEFITIDCGAGGHWGYAYIDDFCSTCGPGPEGAIQAASSSDCGVGKICVDVTVPKAGTQTGQANVSLDIWQNGIKITTLNQPAINADGQVCFPINPSTIAGLDLTKGFDYSAKADLKIGTVILSPKTLGAGPNGTKPGVNNDYSVNCSVGGVCGMPGQPPCPVCGQEGQPPCPTCGQPGQPLCPDICTPANPSGNPNAAASNRLGNFLVNLRNAARGTTGKPAALEKKAMAVGPSINGNYTINWVVSYANTSNQALSNVLVVDGPIATIIPGSLQQPAGWTGATNAASGNTPADNFAQWNGAIVPPHGVMTQTLPSAVANVISSSSGGDGYQPIPYTRISAPAGQRIYVMNHHLKPGEKLFKCFDVTIGSDCAGWAGGKALPMGDNSLNYSGSIAVNPEYIISGSKLYYAAMGSSSAIGMGIGCYDLETDTPCGLIRLDNRAAGVHINGPWLVGSELYAVSNDGQLYCAKFSPGFVPCLSTGYKIPTTDVKINVARTGTDDWDTGRLAGKVVGNKLFITSLNNSEKFLNCFDAATKMVCWNTTTPTKGTAAHKYTHRSGNYTNFLYYSTNLQAQAICSMSKDLLGQFCIDLANGNSFTAPKIVLPTLKMLGGLEVFYSGKTYFINFKTVDGLADAYCWDWSTAAVCSSPADGKIALSPVTAARDYGLNVDSNGCIWAFGDGGKLWNFSPTNLDPATGLAKPCGGDPGKAQLTFQPLQYCSGPKPFKWTAVEVKGTTLANMDKLIVKVLDATTSALLFTKDLKAGGALSTPITSINAQTESKPLKIELEYTPKTGTNDKPYVEVRYDAPALEFCFTSTHTCAQGNITNKVETQDPLNLNTIISAAATATRPQDCPCISCGTANTPSCPACGQTGQPACPSCGQPGQPACGICGGIGQPPCDVNPTCILGTLGCPVVITTCLPGDPLCNPVRPPPRGDPSCQLLGTCPVDKPKQTIAEEFKEPKVSCVRKPKPAEEVPKKIAPKPRPKPVAAAAPAAPVIPDAAAKPKPKPRPKPAQPKAKAQDDDC